MTARQAHFPVRCGGTRQRSICIRGTAHLRDVSGNFSRQSTLWAGQRGVDRPWMEHWAWHSAPGGQGRLRMGCAETVAPDPR